MQALAAYLKDSEDLASQRQAKRTVTNALADMPRYFTFAFPPSYDFASHAYWKEVKEPMDFQMMHDRITCQEYPVPSEYMKDIFLIQKVSQ